MPGKSLLLEVTESAVISDTEEAGRVIQELLKMDVSISIDDFGTGSHVTRIHEGLVRFGGEDRPVIRPYVRRQSPRRRLRPSGRRAWAQSRHAGGRRRSRDTRGLRVLSDVGCDLVQGHLILPAVPGDELAVWARSPQTWSRAARTRFPTTWSSRSPSSDNRHCLRVRGRRRGDWP